MEDLTEKMYQFSQKMLETVPPLVSETISDTLFCKDWHEKELSPEWNEELEDYRLVYYRPIVFFSYEGKVSQKGWVGNTPLDIKNDQVTAGKDHECYYKSYKKPCLKVKQVSMSEQAALDSIPIAGPVQVTKEKASRMNQTPPDTSVDCSYFIGLKKYN